MPEPKDWDTTSVNEIELSVRSANCLDLAHIVTVGQLISYTDKELLRLQNFGKGSLREIERKLGELGLRLGTSPTAGFRDSRFQHLRLEIMHQVLGWGSWSVPPCSMVAHWNGLNLTRIDVQIDKPDNYVADRITKICERHGLKSEMRDGNLVAYWELP